MGTCGYVHAQLPHAKPQTSGQLYLRPLMEQNQPSLDDSTEIHSPAEMLCLAQADHNLPILTGFLFLVTPQQTPIFTILVFSSFFLLPLANSKKIKEFADVV